jgi:hypothetical protein
MANTTMPMSQQTTTTGQTVGQTGTKSTLVRVAESMEWGTQMFLIAFFSLMVMIVSAQICDNYMPNGSCVATRGYQVAAGAASFGFAIIVAIIHMFGKLESVAAQTWISLCFFLWWVGGVIVLTFFGDFTTTQYANGYFGAWGAFIMSLFALVHTSPRFEHGLDATMHSIRKPLFFLIVASAVAMGASIGPCSPRQACQGYSAWALVGSVIMLFIALVLFFLPSRLERNLMKYVAVFLVLWAVFYVGVTTLGGPFRVAGNGFFGAYGTLLASISLLRVLHRENPPTM